MGRLDLEIADLRIHPGATAEKIENLFSRAITLSVEDVKLAAGLTIERIRLSTGDGTASVEDLRRVPELSPEEYLARPNIREPDRLAAAVERIAIDGIEPLGALANRGLVVGTLAISGFELGILHDQHKPGRAPRRQWQPHDIIGELPLRVRVARIELIDGRVVYAERPPEAQRPGTLTFESIAGSISGLNTEATNDEPQPVVASLNTMLMGAAGTVDGATSAIDYVPGTAKRQLDIAYHDARLRIADRAGAQNFGRRIVSFLANRIAVHSANPSRPARRRVPGRSILRSMTPGLSSSCSGCRSAVLFSPY